MRNLALNLGRVTAILAMGTGVLMADGAQTGTIQGTVKGTKGAPVAGVKVHIESPSLQQSRTVTADASGEFRALLLPPGNYTLTFTADGYQTGKADATVAVNLPTKLTMTMAEVGVTEVVIKAQVAQVDTTTSTTQTNITKDTIDKLPGNRDYQSYMSLAPGVSGGGNPNALGGQDSENIYLVDGVDTTDPTTGTFGLNLAEDAVEEVQTLTSGVSAEFGRFNGAVANIVTKSGSNDWEGSLRVTETNLSWNATFPSISTKNDPLHGRPASNPVKTYFASVGGPIIKDHLWFFATGQFVKTSGQSSTTGPVGQGGIPFDRTFKSDPAFYSLKLTWSPTPDHTIILQRTGDPAKINAINYATTTFFNTTTAQKQGGNFLSVSYRGILSSSLTLEAKYSNNKNELDVIPNGGSNIAFYDLTDPLGRQYENGVFQGSAQRPRKQGNVALTWFVDAMGSHEIRTGIDYQSTHSRNDFNYWPNGSVVYFDGFQGGTPNANYDNYIPDTLEIYTPLQASDSKQNYSAAYVNDKWSLNNHWSFNLGIRYEKVKGDNDIGQQIFDYNTFSPRLAATYDFKGDGKTSLGFTYAIYYQSPWQDSLDSLDKLAQGYSDYAYLGQGDPHQRSSFDTTPYYTFNPTNDPGLIYANGLKGSYNREWSIVFKKQLNDETGFQATYIDKHFKNQLDFSLYYDYAPGYNATTDPNQQHVILYHYLKNATDSSRVYKGLLMSLDHRMEDWYFMGSVTLSRLTGNIDQDSETGAYNDYTTGLYHGPGMNNSYAAYQNVAGGNLAENVPVVIKGYAIKTVRFGNNLSLDNGVSFSYSSGSSYSIHANVTDPHAPAYVIQPGANVFSVRDGSRGQYSYPDFWSLNYQASINYAFTKRVSSFFRVKVRNLLNHMQELAYDTTTRATYNYNAAHPQQSTVSFRPASTFGVANTTSDWLTPRNLELTLGVRF